MLRSWGNLHGDEHPETAAIDALLVKIHQARHALDPDASHDEKVQRCHIVTGEMITSSAEQALTRL